MDKPDPFNINGRDNLGASGSGKACEQGYPDMLVATDGIAEYILVEIEGGVVVDKTEHVDEGAYLRCLKF